MERLILKVSLLCILLTGCDRPCVKNTISPAFIGFSKTDIDTILLRSFKPNDNYLHLVDTIFVINSPGLASVFTSIGDATFVYVNDSNPDRRISPGFDWEIYIPAKNRVIRIAEIISQQTEGRGRACYNPINSYLQDGITIIPTLVNTGQFYTSGYFAYIYN